MPQETSQSIFRLSKDIMRFWFTLGFVGIGLETSLKDLFKQVRNFKPIILYLCVQGMDLAVTFLFSWLAFGGIIFPRPSNGTATTTTDMMTPFGI